MRKERCVFPHYGNRLHECRGHWSRLGYLRQTVIRQICEQDHVKPCVLNENLNTTALLVDNFLLSKQKRDSFDFNRNNCLLERNKKCLYFRSADWDVFPIRILYFIR